jgi:hypothetical protein
LIVSHFLARSDAIEVPERHVREAGGRLEPFRYLLADADVCAGGNDG